MTWLCNYNTLLFLTLDFKINNKGAFIESKNPVNKEQWKNLRKLEQDEKPTTYLLNGRGKKTGKVLNYCYIQQQTMKVSNEYSRGWMAGNEKKDIRSMHSK